MQKKIYQVMAEIGEELRQLLKGKADDVFIHNNSRQEEITFTARRFRYGRLDEKRISMKYSEMNSDYKRIEIVGGFKLWGKEQ